MAVTFTPIKKYALPGGILVEEGTWLDDGIGLPEGTWRGDNTVITSEGQIQKITDYQFSNDNGTIVGVQRPTGMQPDNFLTIQIALNDLGTYTVKGFQA